MEKGREEWYELLETPYETIDETRRELFETLEWKQVVAQLFDMFSSYREEVWIDVANIQEDWDLVRAIATLVKTITMNYSDEEKDSFIDAVMKQLRYFKAEFKNREIEQLDLTTEEWVLDESKTSCKIDVKSYRRRNGGRWKGKSFIRRLPRKREEK